MGPDAHAGTERDACSCQVSDADGGTDDFVTDADGVVGLALSEQFQLSVIDSIFFTFKFFYGKNAEVDGRGLTHPLRKVCKSEAQTPQWVILMSTSVSSKGLGVKAWWVRGDVAEVASQPWKTSRLLSPTAGSGLALSILIDGLDCKDQGKVREVEACP